MAANVSIELTDSDANVQEDTTMLGKFNKDEIFKSFLFAGG